MPWQPALPEKPAVAIKAAGARMLKRLGSQIEFFGGSGDESDSKQVPNWLTGGLKLGVIRSVGSLLVSSTAVCSAHLFYSSVPFTAMVCRPRPNTFLR